MKGSWRLFRIAGIDVRVHVTFLFVVALFAFEFGQRHGKTGVAFGVAAALSLFACVTLHEFGHSLVAQRFGIQVKEIVLLPIGGMARLLGEPKKPLHELLIAAAGPAVNVALAFVFLGLLRVDPAKASDEAFWIGLLSTPTPHALIGWLFLNNLYLAAFNLIPAFPLDGGKVLRAVLWFFVGRDRATRVAVRIAQVLSLGLVLLGILTGPQWTWILLGGLIFFWASQERLSSQASEVLAELSAGEVCNPGAQTLSPGDDLGDALDLILRTAQGSFPVVHGSGLVGVVLREDALAAASRAGLRTPVGALMRRDLPVCPSDAPLALVREQLQITGRPVVVVEGQRFLGVLSAADVVRISEASARLAAAGIRRPKGSTPPPGRDVSPSQSLP